MNIIESKGIKEILKQCTCKAIVTILKIRMSKVKEYMIGVLNLSQILN